MIDAAALRDLLRGPGIDSRTWIAIGICRAPAGAELVDFSEGFPLVSVTLQPSDVAVRCRVSSAVAGNGEGEWHPFVDKDEVVVAIPSGNERAAPVIIGRLNNGVDVFPTGSVAGQDPSTNTFGFKRSRTPYVHEVAGPWIVRQATTGALLSIDAGGCVTTRTGAGDAVQLSADVFAVQSADGSSLLQLAFTDQHFIAQAGDAYLQISGSGGSGVSTLLVPQQFAVGTSGDAPIEHAATVEGVANILASVFTVLAAILNVPPLSTTPLTGATLAALLASPAFSTTTLAPGILAAAALPLQPAVVSAIQTALTAQPQKQALPAGQSSPGVGSRGLRVG